MPGKISDLPLLPAAQVAVNDMFEVLDVSDITTQATGENKRTPLGELISANPQSIGTQAGSTYTVVDADAGKLIRLTGTATITLPSAVLQIGQRVDFVCIGGPATFALGGGATWDVPPTPSAVAREVGSFVTAIKLNTTAWALTGDMA